MAPRQWLPSIGRRLWLVSSVGRLCPVACIARLVLLVASIGGVLVACLVRAIPCVGIVTRLVPRICLVAVLRVPLVVRPAFLVDICGRLARPCTVSGCAYSQSSPCSCNCDSYGMLPAS